MKLLVTIITLCSLTGTINPVDIETPYYHLQLSGDWVQQQSKDPEQIILTSKSRQAKVTLAYTPVNTKGEDLVQRANHLLEYCMAEEEEIACDREVIFSDPWAAKRKDGVLQISYLGCDCQGRHFFFSGFLAETHSTIITGELADSNEAELRAFYKEVLGGFDG